MQRGAFAVIVARTPARYPAGLSGNKAQPRREAERAARRTGRATRDALHATRVALHAALCIQRLETRDPETHGTPPFPAMRIALAQLALTFSWSSYGATRSLSCQGVTFSLSSDIE